MKLEDKIVNLTITLFMITMVGFLLIHHAKTQAKQPDVCEETECLVAKAKVKYCELCTYEDKMHYSCIRVDCPENVL